MATKEVKFKSGWLTSEVEAARKEVEEWPNWLREEVESGAGRRQVRSASDKDRATAVAHSKKTTRTK